MKKIFKYPVPTTDVFTIDLPEDAEVLDVQVQRGNAQLWALVNPMADTVTRKFRIFGTGHPIADELEETLVYVGTFQKNETFVWHLFEGV